MSSTKELQNAIRNGQHWNVYSLACKALNNNANLDIALSIAQQRVDDNCQNAEKVLRELLRAM